MTKLCYDGTEREVYKPLFDGNDYAAHTEEWDAGNVRWTGGYRPDFCTNHDQTYEEWNGKRPDINKYMPDWPESERTHFMMYEDTSEGTPISPAFETAEELARWLADSGASAFGGMTASYEQWLRMISQTWVPSAIVRNGALMSGVEGF